MTAVADGGAVILDARDSARAKPFDVADIGHANSGLDAMLKDLETDRPGRYRAYIKNCKHINRLPHDQ